MSYAINRVRAQSFVALLLRSSVSLNRLLLPRFAPGIFRYQHQLIARHSWARNVIGPGQSSTRCRQAA